jgi:cytochrome b
MTTTPKHTVYVWDRFVRLFHWSLVTTIALNLFVLEEGEPFHQWSGYTACLLIGLRIVWGFKGSHYAQFREFWPSIPSIRRELKGVLQGEPVTRLGHSALGALMMIALVLNVLFLGMTGYAMGTDYFFGESWLENLHAMLAVILQILVGLHVLAALLVSHIERVNLIAAMISGYKRFKK